MNKATTPRQITVSHVYSSDNKGDAALTSVLLQDLRRRFPGVKINILSLDIKHKVFENASQSASFMYFALNKHRNKLIKLIYIIYMIPYTLLWATGYRLIKRHLPMTSELRQVADAYVNSDLIVAVGGGYLRSRKGLMNRLNVPLLLHPLLFAHILGKPTVLYPQSVGPFVNWYEPAMVRFTLKRMDLIMLREDRSLEYLKQLGVFKNVIRGIDSGFLLKGREGIDVRQVYKIPDDSLVVGVTVRNWLKRRSQKSYEKAVAAALDSIIKTHKAYILFIPQVTAGNGDDDREVSLRVYGHMKQTSRATVITDTPDHYQIKDMYSSLDVLLGTRFHSVIFSLTAFVPVVAIEYEHKTSGIMHDLGLDEWVIHIKDITEQKLIRLMHKLLLQRDNYQQTLHHRLPSYIGRAEQAAESLAGSYEASQLRNSQN